MCDFSFENGIETESWCAEFALRRRVRKSAIGSVIVMGRQPFLAGVSARWCGSRRTTGAQTFGVVVLPGALGEPGQLAAVRHLTDADAAEAELAVHAVRTSAPLAPG